MSITSEVLLESGEVAHAEVESLEARVASPDFLLVFTETKSIFDMLEQDEISNARVIATKELRRSHVLSQSLEAVDECSARDGLFCLCKACCDGFDECIVGDHLQSVPISALLGRLSVDGRAELLSDILVDSEGLGELEVTDNDVGHVGEFKSEGVLGFRPFILSDGV